MVTVDYIIELVEEKSLIDNIIKKSRVRPLPDLRNIVYALCRKYCPEKTSLAHIGRSVGNRDHATVIHGLKSFDNSLGQYFFKEFDEIYFECCNEIEKSINKQKGKEFLLSSKEATVFYQGLLKAEKDRHDLEIGSLKRANKNLMERSVFREIASLDDDALNDFEKRATAFIQMNRKKVEVIDPMQTSLLDINLVKQV